MTKLDVTSEAPIPDMSDLIIDVMDPLNGSEWNNWLQKNRNSTVFHSSNWARLLVESYDYHPVYLTVSERGVLKGCLPVMEVDSPFTGKRGVCLSFSDYCGAVLDGEEFFQPLFNTVLEYGRSKRWRYIEFRGEDHLNKEKPSKVFAHHSIELSTDESLMLSRLRKSTARNIQKAVKEGVTVDFGKTLQGVLDFYHLHCLTRQRQGLPPQPKSFFVKLHEHLIAQNLGFTALARHGTATVAGVMCLHFGKRAIYKYGASDSEFQQLRANNLLFWELIKKCGQKGFEYLSLGRTDLENEGLLVFKDGWGGQRKHLYYFRYDLKLNEFVSSENNYAVDCRSVLKRLPIGLLKVLGSLAYRHMG